MTHLVEVDQGSHTLAKSVYDLSTFLQLCQRFQMQKHFLSTPFARRESAAHFFLCKCTEMLFIWALTVSNYHTFALQLTVQMVQIPTNGC